MAEITQQEFMAEWKLVDQISSMSRAELPEYLVHEKSWIRYAARARLEEIQRFWLQVAYLGLEESCDW